MTRARKITLFAVFAAAIFAMRFSEAGAATWPETVARYMRQSAPAVASGSMAEPGIRFLDVQLTRGSRISHLWIYEPVSRGKKLPCIFVAPSGTEMFTGRTLRPAVRDELLPYARDGYIAVGYELDGEKPDSATPQQVAKAAAEFEGSQAGLLDFRTALAYTLKHLKMADPHRIFVAGHSSAGTVALFVAEHDSRVKGCIAFAPVCDIALQLREDHFRDISRLTADFGEFLHRVSPSTDVRKLKCPVFLFHSSDDDIVRSDGVLRFVAALSKTNHKVTFVSVNSGGHYDSMLNPGIPRAIAWLNHETSH